jgi:hypothetical protein
VTKSISQAVKEAMAGAHSPLGASAADRWINCPGSVGATINLPDVDTDYSLEGTAAHWLAEHCNEMGIKTASVQMTNIPVRKVDGTTALIPLDKEMRDGVQKFLDYVNDLPGDDYNEERVHWHEFVPNAFGTMDRARATKVTLRIVDLKYGEGWQVWAEKNPQLMLYALGFIEKYGWMYAIEYVALTVFQPRLDHVDTWTVSVHELRAWAKEVMQPAAELAQTDDAPFAAGDHCKFCKLRATCATRARYVFEGAVGELDDMDALIDAPVRSAVTLSNEQIARILPRKKQITAFFSDLEHFAFREIAQGRAVGDWKVVEGRSNRVWAFDKDEVVRRVKAQKLEAKLLWTEPELISPAQAEDKFGKALFAPEKENKKSGAVIPAGPLADLIDKPRGRAVLAPGSDRRPSIQVDANEMEDVSAND